MTKQCNLHFVGNLLFKEYPSTIVYSHDNSRPFIVEWVDEDSDGVDVFFIYESTKEILKQYIEGEICHLELIKKAKNGITVFFNGTVEKPENRLMSDVMLINEDYLPSKKNYFDKGNSEDIDKIVSYFEL